MHIQLTSSVVNRLRVLPSIFPFQKVMATKGRITRVSSGELGGSELRCKAVSIGETTESHSNVAEVMNTEAIGSSTAMLQDDDHEVSAWKCK